MTGTNSGPLAPLEGLTLPTVPATGREIRLNVCRVACWRDGEIAQLNLFADVAGAARQLGLA